MTIIFILVFTLLGLIIGWLRPHRQIKYLILVLSAISLYWLQPLTPVRTLDFWFPTVSIALTIFVWAATYPSEDRSFRQALPGLAILIAVILGIGLSRYVDALCCITPAKPPQYFSVIGSIFIVLAGFGILYFLFPNKPAAALIIGLIILVLFVFLKLEATSRISSVWLRMLTNQPTSLASSTDLPWLGFSFLAFRLLHVIRDKQSNRLPAFTLSEFACYALFFPAWIAGPIDRSQHFIAELRKSESLKTEEGWRTRAARNTFAGIQRILIGTFKKFVLADSLAVFSLSAQNATQNTSTIWTWVFLLAFSLRIYFDFAGYTDIALGVARIIGIQLPENFDRPYSKKNLTAFWNSWHITLAQWFRSYVFYPFTRRLRSQKSQLPVWFVILAGQFLTMTLIGLWHGITWNFFIWGAWHGIGLFIQNRWSEWARPRLITDSWSRTSRLTIEAASWLATFGFVSLGWVWFALPTPELSLTTFATLFGGGLR
jgi:alginate O-acetyltransferase complex protein AlgI